MDLIVQLKANQKSLLRQVEAGCDAAIPATSCRTIDQHRRNRHETRTTTVFDAAAIICAPEWRDAVTTIVRVKCVNGGAKVGHGAE